MEQILSKSTFQKYPAYKDSNSDWVTSIPQGWNELSIKHIFEERKKK